MSLAKISLDTNAYSLLLRGDRVVADIVEQAEVIFISSIVIAELLYGFKNGSKKEKNKQILETFLEKNRVQLVTVSLETADFFSDIKTNLKKVGKPIPINDIWIAAQAMESGSTLLSKDKHFSYISGLRTDIL